MPKTGLGSMVGHPETRGALVGETGARRRGRDEAERLVDNCGVFFRGSRGDLEAWSLGGQGRPSGCRPNYYRSSRPSGTRNRGRGLGGVDESALPRNHQDSTRSRGGWVRTRAVPHAIRDAATLNGSDEGGMEIRKAVMGSGPGGAAAAVDALGQKLRGLHRGEHHAEEGAASPDSRHHKGLAGLKPDRSSPGAGTFAGFPQFPPNFVVPEGTFRRSSCRLLFWLPSASLAPPGIASDRGKMAVDMTSQHSAVQPCPTTSKVQITARQGSHREAHGERGEQRPWSGTGFSVCKWRGAMPGTGLVRTAHPPGQPGLGAEIRG